MKKLIIYTFLASLLFFAGCEYEPTGENFIEISPPDGNIEVAISLNDINPSDTIYVYQNSTFTLNIFSTKNLLDAKLYMDDEYFTSISENPVNFNINPINFTEGVHKLTVRAAFASGTGSLAELLNMEGYLGEISWNIRVIQNPQNHFTTGYRTNNEGFMEVFWTSDLPESIMERYQVHSGLTQVEDAIISDPSQNYFVDYGYVCGYAVYDISIYLKGGKMIRKQLSVDIPAPSKVYFESFGLDSLHILWNKPFANGRFNLSCDGKLIATDITDTMVSIPHIYGKNRQFSLEIRPQKTGYDNFHNKFSAWNWFSLGTSLGLPNWELYAFNIKDNILYTTTYGSLVALDGNTLAKINTIEIPGKYWGLDYGGKLATAPHNSTIAAMTGEETWIFTDSRFTNAVRISPLRGDENTRLSALTSNDRFFVVLEGSNICKVFHSLTGELITEIPFLYKTIYTFPDMATVSEDGQYFCASSDSGIEVFKITGTNATVVFTDTRNYKGAMFIPSQPDKLLLRVGTALEIRQMPGFDLVQSLDVSAKGALLCNIDPVSHNLLYFSNDSLRVCNINRLSETLFKIRSDETTCKMFNNKMLTYGKGGICLDISPYINKKSKNR